ncbi:hypothetical protein [Alteriqipengyuania sp. 357]
MSKFVHPIAGTLATLLVAGFWLSTVAVEAIGTHAQIASLKMALPWAFLLLVPALAATGGTGMIRSRGHRGGIVGRKLRRMPIVAANGIIVLIPAALFLAWKARAGEFDTAFYAVQALELVAGAVNFALLALNMRDGLRMTRRLPVALRRS